jgi:hypothetical protein
VNANDNWKKGELRPFSLNHCVLVIQFKAGTAKVIDA